jgi:AcrR family transcriptional regulator
VAETPAVTRRDRLRAATMEEITATARRLLVEQGPEAVSLRAIAREMGMTAPGLYRYYSSRDELLRYVIAEMFRELAGDIHRAIAEAVPSQGPTPRGAGARATGARGARVREAGAHRDAEPLNDPERRTHVALKMVAACREFRRWGLGHKEEFALLFGVPLPGLDERRFDIAEQCALEFAGTFYALFLEVWHAIRFPVPDPSQIDPALRAQLARFRDKLRTDAPDGAILVFLRCWVQLYGAVSMEIFGHMRFALDDPAPMFELTLGDLARRVGLEYPLPET